MSEIEKAKIIQLEARMRGEKTSDVEKSLVYIIIFKIFFYNK